MFFIIWGNTSRYDKHGVVGDVCPVCDRVQAFTVIDVYSVGHVYYIPLGSGSFQARVKSCWGCGSDFHARLKDYDGFVDEDDAPRMSLRKIIRLTNEPLARWMDENMPIREREISSPRNAIAPTEDDYDRRAERRRYSNDRPANASGASDRRPKNYYYNQRLLAWLGVIAGFFGILLFSLTAYNAHRDWERYGDGPTAITAAELIQRGPATARYVRVTGLQLGPQILQEGGGNDDTQPYWLVAAPKSDPPLDRGNNVPPARLILLRIDSSSGNRRIQDIEKSGEFTGFIGRADPQPPFDVRRAYERHYPGSEISQTWVVKDSQPLGIESFYFSATLLTCSGLLVLASVIYYIWIRGAERSKARDSSDETA